MSNPFVHVELNSTNLGKAREFYGKLFDWQTRDMPMPGGKYTTIDVGQGTGGGMLEQHATNESAWLPYVQVEDIKAYTNKARTLGAKVIKDVAEVPEMGWLSIIADPTGAKLGLWQPGSKSRPT
jgi:predicted enzyme related to lactoylglutathione lyase